jgi:hypothetical protein
MFSSKMTLLFALVAFIASARAFQIYTPSKLVQCQTTKIEWKDGKGPFFLAVVPGADPCADILHEFPETNTRNFNWTVNLPVGTSVMFAIEDADGNEQYTGALKIEAGTDKACLTASSSVQPSATISKSLPSGSAGVEGLGNVGGNPTPGSAASSTAMVSTAFVALMSAFSALYVLQ